MHDLILLSHCQIASHSSLCIELHCSNLNQHHIANAQISLHNKSIAYTNAAKNEQSIFQKMAVSSIASKAVICCWARAQETNESKKS
jgi:hypothetical protein